MGVGVFLFVVLGKDGWGERTRPFPLDIGTFPDIVFPSEYLLFMFVVMAVLVIRHGRRHGYW